MFEVPPGYTVLGSKQRDTLREEEEDLLQFAIQQSLLDAGSEHDQVGWLGRASDLIFALQSNIKLTSWFWSLAFIRHGST